MGNVRGNMQIISQLNIKLVTQKTWIFLLNKYDGLNIMKTAKLIVLGELESVANILYLEIEH